MQHTQRTCSTVVGSAGASMAPVRLSSSSASAALVAAAAVGSPPAEPARPVNADCDAGRVWPGAIRIESRLSFFSMLLLSRSPTSRTRPGLAACKKKEKPH
jgi:hypothetical protein